MRKQTHQQAVDKLKLKIKDLETELLLAKERVAILENELESLNKDAELDAFLEATR